MSYRRHTRRGLTAAQQEAHEAAYDRCDHTVEGRFARHSLIADQAGNVWRVETYGIAYHEDVGNRLYGVRPARGPDGWRETREIRAAIERVLRDGTHEPGSRGGSPETQAPRPAGDELTTWEDRRPDSMASYPTLSIYGEDGAPAVIGVVQPNYDDSPSIAWLCDHALARKLAAGIAACPTPVSLPHAQVRVRETVLTITPDHPRYAAYAAAPGAVASATRIVLPRPEWRKLKAHFDTAKQATT